MTQVLTLSIKGWEVASGEEVAKIHQMLSGKTGLLRYVKVLGRMSLVLSAELLVCSETFPFSECY